MARKRALLFAHAPMSYKTSWCVFKYGIPCDIKKQGILLIVASAKIGNAVYRNLIKRRLRSWYKQSMFLQINKGSGSLLVIIRHHEKPLSFNQIYADSVLFNQWIIKK